ncbi:DMT family transporter [Oceanicoccus sp. KOV_DT_Chl]|uniref:DMT family transporter n=1 Tax=Oceanicoccus sp. KOV_DT_Chl TaxID=1904639 RepID=UPI000C7CC38E|nr:DMT family transporter [Oceanicoccus sp. KOV_DT_Chl]
MTNRRAELLLLSVALIAAVGWILSKMVLSEMEAYTFMSIRFLLAAATLALFCGKDIRQLDRNQIFRCLATGTALGSGLLCWSLGLKLTDKVGEGAFIVSLGVVVVPLVGRIFFAEKISLLLLVSLIPAVAGLYFLALDNMQQGLGFGFDKAQYCFLGSILAFALHLNLSGHYVTSIAPLALSTLQLGMAGLMATVGALLVDPPLGQQHGGEIAQLTWVLLIASALVATSLRFSLQTQALQHLKPSHASMILLAEPVLTVLMSMWWLDEVLSGNQIVGCLLIFGGVVFYRLGPVLRRR